MTPQAAARRPRCATSSRSASSRAAPRRRQPWSSAISIWCMVHGDPNLRPVDETSRWPARSPARSPIPAWSRRRRPRRRPSASTSWSRPAAALPGARLVARRSPRPPGSADESLRWCTDHRTQPAGRDYRRARGGAAPANLAVFRFRRDFPACSPAPRCRSRRRATTPSAISCAPAAARVLVPFAAGGETEQTGARLATGAAGLARVHCRGEPDAGSCWPRRSNARSPPAGARPPRASISTARAATLPSCSRSPESARHHAL